MTCLVIKYPASLAPGEPGSHGIAGFGRGTLMKVRSGNSSAVSLPPTVVPAPVSMATTCQRARERQEFKLTVKRRR